jgi:hypothetical protein
MGGNLLNGWGARARTWSLLIQSQTSYQFDHTPTFICLQACFLLIFKHASLRWLHSRNEVAANGVFTVCITLFWNTLKA